MDVFPGIESTTTLLSAYFDTELLREMCRHVECGEGAVTGGLDYDLCRAEDHTQSFQW